MKQPLEGEVLLSCGCGCLGPCSLGLSVWVKCASVTLGHTNTDDKQQNYTTHNTSWDTMLGHTKQLHQQLGQDNTTNTLQKQTDISNQKDNESTGLEDPAAANMTAEQT